MGAIFPAKDTETAGGLQRRRSEQLMGGGQGRMKTNNQMQQGASTPGRRCSLVTPALG